jgi:hypothetical protein
MFGIIGVLVGIVLILIGGFLVFFFPSTAEHQPPPFDVVGVVLGFILIIIGGILIFVA